MVPAVQSQKTPPRSGRVGVGGGSWCYTGLKLFLSPDPPSPHVIPRVLPTLLAPPGTPCPSTLGTSSPHAWPSSGPAIGSTWQAGAFVGGVPRGAAGAPVLAGGGAAGHVGQLAEAASVGGPTRTAVGADLVDAGAAVLAGPRVLATFVHVLPAGGAVEGGWAATDVRGLEGQTLATIGTRIGSTWVSLLAHLPWWVRGMKGSCRPGCHGPCSRGLPPSTREVTAWNGPIISLILRTPPQDTAIFLQARDCSSERLSNQPSQDTCRRAKVAPDLTQPVCARNPHSEKLHCSTPAPDRGPLHS